MRQRRPSEQDNHMASTVPPWIAIEPQATIMSTDVDVSTRSLA
jgi:hypothetical protein